MTKHGMRTPGTGSMAKGWPDMTLVREKDHRLLFVELKSDVGKLSPDQERVLGVLRALEAIHWNSQTGHHAIEVHVWRPRDFDQIEGILR